MIPQVTHYSNHRSACAGKIFILYLVFLLLLPCSQWALFDSLCMAADEDRSKAVKRNSSETKDSGNAQRRIALVIGNSDYKVGPLANPAHDAEDVSMALKSLGFEVETKVNVNHREMEEAVNKFVQKIQNGEIALFYFSGHGVQVRGENYLIPVGDSIQSEPDVRYKTVNAGLILAKMEDSRNRANIVILDACRNNPFKGLFRSPGMGLSKMDAPKGTFIAYATSPDSVAADGAGRNSPYTKHLLGALLMKNVPIELAFKQVARAVNQDTGGEQIPWISSSLLDEFYFNPTSSISPQELSPQTPPDPVQFSAYYSDLKEKAQRLLRIASARGDESARLDLNRLYKEPEAVKSFRQAAEQGDAVAQLMVGRMLAAGLDVPKDEKEAAKWFRKAADQGNAVAQNNLGSMYSTGLGVVQDHAEAMKWFKKAADQDNAPAYVNLATMYQFGRGAPKDEQEAFRCYSKAAEQGFIPAEFHLGTLYEAGSLVPKDYKEAVKWYSKAAEQGLPRAQAFLAMMIRNGKGIQKDYRKAFEWAEKSASQNDGYGLCVLGNMYVQGHGVPKNRKEGFSFIRKGAELGDSRAMSDLGWLYDTGQGVTVDLKEAFRWYRKSAELGDDQGMANLGNCYRYGRGVAQDRQEAIKWLTQAADRGNEDARKWLAQIKDSRTQRRPKDQEDE